VRRLSLTGRNYSRDLRPVKWGSGSVCTAAILGRSCPLWINNGHCGTSDQCPLYPQKRTLELVRITFGVTPAASPRWPRPAARRALQLKVRWQSLVSLKPGVLLRKGAIK